MKKSSKILFSLGGVAVSALLLTSCTASFCSDVEKARMLSIIDAGVTTYYDGATEQILVQGETEESTIKATPAAVEGFDKLYSIPSRTFTCASKIVTIETNAANSGYVIPSIDYWATIDAKVLNLAYTEYASKEGSEAIGKSEVTAEVANEILKHYSYVKFCASPYTDGDGTLVTPKLWENWTSIHNETVQEVGIEKAGSQDFESYYQTQMKNAIANYKSCITTVDGIYGSYGSEGQSIEITAKSWKYAWKKGFIEGLLVYPVAWLIDKCCTAFGYDAYNPNATGGVAQLLAILVVTLIVRGLLIAVSMKSTIGQQKMTQLQPELAKIQAKYPNSNTNTAQKQRLAQEQMMLYKKHKINPLSSLLVLVFQFPFFIAVWSAMTGSAALSSGSFLGLKLSDSIGSVLTGYIKAGGFKHNAGGWWTAVVLFLLMAVAQFFSMKLTQFIQKAKNKKLTKLGKNPAQDQTNKTMKMVSTFMLVMIIVMGFSLPSAMGVYWLVGALISIAQTGIMQAVMAKNEKKKKYRK